MSKWWYFKLGIVIFLVIFPLLCLWSAFDKDSWVHKWLKTSIFLGLDLQGGIRLVYEVEISQAIRDRRNNLAKTLQQNIEEQLGIEGVEALPSLENDTDFIIRFPSEGDAEKCDKKFLRDWYSIREKGRYKKDIIFTLSDESIDNIKETAVEQAAQVIRNRVDELGLVNASVSVSGVDIIIEIPGRPGTAMVDRIKRIIKRTARLEFKIVDDEEKEIYNKLSPLVFKDKHIKLMEEGHSYYLLASDIKEENKVVSGKELLEKFLKEAEKQGIKPKPNRIFLIGEVTSGKSSSRVSKEAQRVWRTYYLVDEAKVTGEHIQEATVAYDSREGNMPFVSLNFNEEGKKLFGEVTTNNVHKRLAIILDEVVYSAPEIQEPITGGRARITMGGYKSFKELQEEAKDLVVVLRAGALPAPITLINENIIGPSLGSDSIRKGEISITIGVLFVILFIVIYYRLSGIIADFALGVNLLLILATMSILGPAVGATLTLPGIAGIALTMGMAVDTNIIIYERIREELRIGKSPKAAVEAGYNRALLTIIDAQATTFIAGVVLWQYGTGPIKGFAITLLIGIITTLITGIFVTRVMMDWLVRGKKTESLSI